MLDPLIALGAVANVTQFVELAVKIFAKSHSIYNSANGSLVEHDDLGKVSEDISVLSRKLQESLTTTAASSSLTADEQALCDLCKGCIDVSQELRKALKKFTGQGKRGRFRSFRQALKSVWSKDDIDNLERRVRMYKEELNIRIIVGLRTKIDVVALQQSEGYASIADETKSVVQSLVHIDAKIQNAFERQHTTLDTLHSRTEMGIKAHAKQNNEEHKQLSSQITELSQQSGDQSGRVLGVQIDTRAAIEISIDQNLAEHNKTREEMNRLKEQAERQVEVLTEEIRQLKIELEASVKTIVASLGTASKKEEQKLKDTSNAKFNLWVAKELILEKLKAFIAMFCFSSAMESWTGTNNITTWKLMPYPKPFEGSPTGTIFASSGTSGDGEESMVYDRMDVHYPIEAINVPMVKMCLDLGADVTTKSSDGKTPLMVAVAVACDIKYVCLPLARRDARQIIQLLLDHGAEKSPEARQLTRNPHGPHWLIEQLLAPSPHPKICHFISMTDAVSAGDQKKLEDILTQEPELLHSSEIYGASPLGIAVYQNDKPMVNMLLGKGASPNTLDPLGSSLLATAIKWNRKAIVRSLLQYGASITLEDPELKGTPLEYATRIGDYSMCQVLIKSAKAQSRSEKRRLLSKPFALAIVNLRYSLIEIFLEHGADVFMDMRPFLCLDEVVCSLKRWKLNPDDQDWKTTLTPRKLLKSNRNVLKKGIVFPRGLPDSLAVLEIYENQKNKEVS